MRRGNRGRGAIAAVCVALAFGAAGCGEDDLDSTPEKQDGSPSGAFEGDDIERAENADRLVEIYCDGGASEAQVTGCLSHVDVSQVCEQDTDGKTRAVEKYVDETGDDAVCD